MNAFAKRRKSAGLLQEDVAAKLDVDRSTVAKWETGASMPRAAMLPSIAKLYQCQVTDLLPGNDEKAV